MIYAFCGPIGHGKSFTQLRKAVEIAQRDKKDLVSNVPLNLQVLHEYCLRRGFYWLAQRIRRGYVFYDADFTRIASYGRCVVIADELGIFMNNREGLGREDKKERMRFIKALILSRKAGMDLLWVAQDEEMVDTQIRSLTQFYFQSHNSEPKKQKASNTRLFIVTFFEASRYQKWFKNQTFKTWFKYNLAVEYLMMGWPGEFVVRLGRRELRIPIPFGGAEHALLFGAYDTNYRLDETKVYTMAQVGAELGLHPERVIPLAKLQPVAVPEGYVPGKSKRVPVSTAVPARSRQLSGIKWVRRPGAARPSASLRVTTYAP